MRRLALALVIVGLSAAPALASLSYDIPYANMPSDSAWLCDTGDLYSPHEFHDEDGDPGTVAYTYSKGSNANETLDVSSNNNKYHCLDGKAGHDVIYGADNHDILFGSNGNDYVEGDYGSDVIDGGYDHDELHGNQNGDWIYGGYGDDWIYGGTGGDDLFGGYRACTETNYYGYDAFDLDHDGNIDSPPNDFSFMPLVTCSVGGGADVIYGNGGDDWIWEGNSDNVSDGDGDYIDGGAGYDHCAVGPEDVYYNCEVVDVLTRGPNT